MPETHLGTYTHRSEPVVHLELVGRTDSLTEQKAFLVDSGFNGAMMVPLSVVIALGWKKTNSFDKVNYGGGEPSRVMKTRGRVHFAGKLCEIDILATMHASRYDAQVEIEGCIGMGILKGSRIDFGLCEFKISVLEW
jgi:predicted aspartyl protease